VSALERLASEVDSLMDDQNGADLHARLVAWGWVSPSGQSLDWGHWRREADRGGRPWWTAKGNK